MAVKKGTLSIDSENIFPIIKKWVYSDHDIFVRELVSNGCDAITKLKKLDMMGEYELPEDYKPKIEVIVNPEEKTMKFIDNGLGMTAEEVEEYITQIAFSGATQFLEKYKDKTTDDEMIGHFGLGFYSAFMVADEVQIDTLSYKEGAKPVHWASQGGTEYEMQEGNKTTVGSEITLFLNEDSLEFANEYRAREVLERYCSFMPVEIFLSKANAEPEYDTIDEADVLDTDTVVEHITEEPKEGEEGEPKQKAKIVRRPVSISDTHPLWTKNPSECTKDDYIDFYRKVFMDYKEPLFWIHLNMDYPFNLKGILYFPKINTEYDSIEGKIKLYNNQVFIADNIKEVIPEFLMVLKGVIDCPDLPLNVSRSALQNDGFVNKVADYISKKVADKLNGMFKTDRENYEKYWDDISPFIKFGCLKDEKFGEKMKNSMLYKNLDHKYMTLEDIIKEAKGEEADATKTEETKEEETKTDAEESKDTDAKEEEKTRIFYVTDEVQQSQYINMFKAQGQDAIILTHNIDSAFITYLEQKHQEVQFLRIDADVHDSLKDEVAEDEKEEFQKTTDSLVEIFRKELGNEKLDVKVEKLKDENVASMAVLSEENRRMQEMMKMYGMGGMDASMFGSQATLVLNANHPLVQFLVANKDSKNVSIICKQLYDLAMLAHKPLIPEEMTAFVKRSNDIMMLLTK
ncbi:molecular chaperone HtpG [Mediterraneibacter faecis]|uniref:molecular chaperone HtpG n=1 Tax=Mediterraneibacter faecis TaxID=592978 RepID=UPI001D07B137|nr:molecular chaperone HtpG [Mediterraneibacter faecis]MCB5919955.1 molecular chaperone HtpG [Lachnospiraceae bacterium 210521-DFI.1.105]MCB6298106.1 molecular chaperone HtpG [Mediterraneibacter faecis]MCB6444409.1 molecular chaperone HtpG [Mediterraneibacter faecis]MCQ5256420.1 molecular chaperone HtpG [Mediterraneibacter faecis]MCQ5259342.1 molecular chaperone HtpG [Mediterraneibacter faecis]